ncbi:MAG TPA: GNAT family N-acetyltransferase [Pseudoduganella sp.]
MIIRAMSRQELDVALDWAAAEGWNPGLHDADCFYAADPGGYLAGFIDGAMAASIFAVRYGASFGFIGGYIVKPEYRGKGCGIAIWNAGMARLAGRNVALDGVVAQQPNYAKSGFVLAHRNIRFEGLGSGRPAPAAGIERAPDHAGLARYDRAFFADDRTAFLRCWTGQPQHVTLAARVAGGIAGYAVMRPCRNGYKIGPLFADTPELAEQLFTALQGEAPQGAALFLDVPEPNEAALALAQRHQLRPCFETARMYTAGEPEISLARTYGITTFELG